MSNELFPRQLTDSFSFGAACRANRLALKMTLSEAALAAGVSIRFASELENGKPSAQLDRAFRYATTLGIELFYRTSSRPEREGRRRTVRSPLGF